MLNLNIIRCLHVVIPEACLFQFMRNDIHETVYEHHASRSPLLHFLPIKEAIYYSETEATKAPFSLELLNLTL
jgi:hypothetical protein